MPDPARIQDLFLTRLEDLEKRVTRELTRPIQASGPLQTFALDVAREAWRIGARALERVLSPHELLTAATLAIAAAPTDELGVDRRLASIVREVVRPLAHVWLGADAEATETLPARGGVLVTFNRSAWPLPTEALVLWAVLAGQAGARRDVYVLWDPDVLALPYVGGYLQRIGLVAATAENARLLLERGALVIGFPEGAAAREKTYERRYRLERFEERYLVSAAFAAGARIVPGAVVGSEESYPLLGHLGALPITPSFPLAGPLGLLPLPLRWRIRLAAPIEYAREHAGGAEPHGLDDAVRARMQAMLGELIAERESILYG
jgi:1-acyl-sn-glycerol-3-phosphate acyltransferase